MKKTLDYNKDLAERLPELKKIEGFPIGKDEDIVALSQPPYYTACPNPYIAEFIKKNGTLYDETTDDYHNEPFVGDISEGKSDPSYKAFSYHTKVPYKAIMQYIKHYTKVNDLVIDGFSGTGMTGLAAQTLNRNVILSDLSPLASVISLAYNQQRNPTDFLLKANTIIKELEMDLNWVYSTDHYVNGKLIGKGIINYTVLSEVFECPFCNNNEFSLWDSSVDFENKSVKEIFNCSKCNAEISKSNSNRKLIKVSDDITGNILESTKRVPVLINYLFNKKLYYKIPDSNDLEIIKKIEKTKIAHWYPIDKMMDIGSDWGDSFRAGYHTGIDSVHHFFTKRNLYVLSKLFSVVKNDIHLLAGFLSNLSRASIRNRYMPQYGNRHVGALSGTLYIPSFTEDNNVLRLFKTRVNSIVRGLKKRDGSNFLITVNSATSLLSIPNNSVDYIFTDPPFGDNLMYSELNFIGEAWLKVKTNNNSEAIINTHQSKDLSGYNALMQNCFKEYYRVLKPNRWVTVEFHNSRSSVWKGIQESLMKAGFIVANVAILDKKKGTITQLVSSGAVKNDLVISAYKPKKGFEDNFLISAGQNLEAEFVNQFISNLPIQPKIERTDKMLYSKMLAYYIQRGYEIKYDAKSFYSLLKTNFIEEDGFWFTANQINSYLEYKKKMKLEGLEEIISGAMFLFVSDEKSSIIWLFNFLSESKSFSEIHTAFTQLANIQGDNVPELREILEQNFIFENEKYRRPKSEPEHNQITEKREKALQREFESLLIKTQTEKGKIKQVRKEALSFGFEMCYKGKRFQDILAISNKLDKTILENSAELTDFVEAAEIMVQGVS